MLPFLKRIERVIVSALLIMMVITVFLATIEVGWILAKDVITEPMFLLEVEELLDIFGLFLLVLIGIELMETLKVYLTERAIHVEVVFTVALIAVGRKVIILDVKELPGTTLWPSPPLSLLCLSDTSSSSTSATTKKRIRRRRG